MHVKSPSQPSHALQSTSLIPLQTIGNPHQEQLDAIFKKMEQPNSSFGDLEEFRRKICELSPHPLRERLGEWIENSTFFGLKVSKTVELAKRFLAFPSEKIESFTENPKFKLLRGREKYKAAHLLLANEELYQYKEKILEFFGATTCLSKNCGVDPWAQDVDYDSTLPVSFSRLIQWHKRLFTSDFLPDQSLALFNKLCTFVKNGGQVISEELMTFLLSFESTTRLGIVDVLFEEEKKRCTLLKRCSALIPRDAAPNCASGIVHFLRNSSEKEFQEAVQLASYCEYNMNTASTIEELCKLSDKQAYLALFETLTRKKIPCHLMQQLLSRLSQFTAQERTLYFRAMEQLEIYEDDEVVKDVKQLVVSSDLMLREPQAYHASCLFLTCPELLEYKTEIIGFFAFISENTSSCTREWTERFFYHPALPVPFSQILQWHQRLTDSDPSEQSLAFFNKLCNSVEKGRREISEDLFDFLLFFPPAARLGAIEILLGDADILEKSRSLFSSDAHPEALMETIRFLNTLSKEKRQEGFQEIVQLASYCQLDQGYSTILESLYGFSNEQRIECCALFGKLSCKKLTSNQMEKMLTRLSRFNKRERAAYFNAVEKMVLEGDSEEVTSVKEILRPLKEQKLDIYWGQEDQLFRAACLFLSNNKLLQHKDQIIKFFKAVCCGEKSPGVKGWIKEFDYHPALAVPFEQILKWHQSLSIATFSPGQSLALFNKLCRVVKKWGSETSDELFIFLHSFEPLTRLGMIEVLLEKEECSDILEKSLSLISSKTNPDVAVEVIQYLATLSKEKRQQGFEEVVTLARYCEQDGDYVRALTLIFDFPDEERRALIHSFKAGVHQVFTGNELFHFFRLLFRFEPKERLSCFNEIEKLLTKDGTYAVEDAFQRLRFQGILSLEKIVMRMQEFLEYFKSDLNRALLVRICSRPRWMKELRTLLPIINNQTDERKKGLLLLLTFLPPEKRELFMDSFLQAEQGDLFDFSDDSKELDNKTLLEFFLAIPEKDRKHSFLSICCDAFLWFSDPDWIDKLKELFWWTPPDQFKPLFNLLLSLEPDATNFFQDYCFRSSFAPKTIPHLRRLVSKPIYPHDKIQLSELIIRNRLGLGIVSEDPIVQDAIQHQTDPSIQKNHQIHQDILKKHQVTSPIKIELKAVQVNDLSVQWNLDSLQRSFSKPYTFADLAPNVSFEAFNEMFAGLLKHYPWYGPLGVSSPYPALIALEGKPQEKIPTTKFYLHTLMRHFKEATVKEMLGWSFYCLQPFEKGYEKSLDFLKNHWSAYRKKNANTVDSSANKICGFGHALGFCYYKLPVHKRVYDAKSPADSQFILNCFKTSVQKVFYQTFVEQAKEYRYSDEESIVLMHNLLSRHVGFPHLPVYPDKWWHDYYTALYGFGKTDEQLVEQFFSVATPTAVIKEMIADSRTLIANNYWPALAKVLPANARSYLDSSGKALNEEGALKILEKLGVIKCEPSEKADKS